jgi:hypothetical protein
MEADKPWSVDRNASHISLVIQISARQEYFTTDIIISHDFESHYNCLKQYGVRLDMIVLEHHSPKIWKMNSFCFSLASKWPNPIRTSCWWFQESRTIVIFGCVQNDTGVVNVSSQLSSRFQLIYEYRSVWLSCGLFWFGSRYRCHVSAKILCKSCFSCRNIWMTAFWINFWIAKGSRKGIARRSSQ